MKKQAIILILTGVIMTTGLPLFAAESEQTTALDEMVVTAGRTEEAKRDVTVNIMVIDQQEIEMSTALDLGQLLADNSIGHIQRYPGALTTFGIRGFRGESHGNDLMGHVLLLLNGRRAGTGNVAHMPTENIEKIEIIRGPSSVQYGSAAIGGLINVITKQGQKDPSLFVGGKLGSFGYEEVSAGVSGKIKNFDLSVFGKRSMKDDYDTADDEAYDNTGTGEKETVSVNMGYEFMPDNRIGTIYTLSDTDKAGSPSYLSQNDPDNHTNQRLESFDFVYDGQTSDATLSWKAKYFTGKEEYMYSDPTSGYVSERDTDQEGAQAQLTWHPGAYQMTTGIDWVNYDIDPSSGTATNEYDNPAYFLLGKVWLLEEQLILSGGMRYDEYEVDYNQNQGGTEKDENISPSFGVAFLPVDSLKFRINYSEGFKMPDAQQLAANYTTSPVIWGGMTFPGTTYLGNPSLDPEKSKNYEVGVDYAESGYNASLTWFYTDFEDKIIVYSPTFTSKSWKNLGDATVSGFEGDFSCDLGAIFDLGWELRPYANFVYLTEYEDEETNEDLKYTSDLQATYGISVSNYDDVSADLNFAYTGEQKYDDWPNMNWATMTEPEVKKTGGYTTANLSIKKRLVSFDDLGQLDLTTEIRNLLNTDYEHVAGYPAPGRSFYAGVKYTY